jgi:Tat protein secretion system quality control protein TatD with DNase activity
VAEKIADLKNLSLEEVAQATTTNAQSLFRLDLLDLPERMRI